MNIKVQTTIAGKFYVVCGNLFSLFGLLKSFIKEFTDTIVNEVSWIASVHKIMAKKLISLSKTDQSKGMA